MTANKTRPTTVLPKDFLATVEPERRREDALELLDFFNRVTGWVPQMWGGSIIGYGRYAYKYQSGRKGEFFITGFSPRKTALSIYIMPGYRDLSDKLARLGNDLAENADFLLQSTMLNGSHQCQRQHFHFDRFGNEISCISIEGSVNRFLILVTGNDHDGQRCENRAPTVDVSVQLGKLHACSVFRGDLTGR